MRIGNIELSNNIILAPMAGITDLSFRIICKEMGQDWSLQKWLVPRACIMGTIKLSKSP